MQKTIVKKCDNVWEHWYLRKGFKCPFCNSFDLKIIIRKERKETSKFSDMLDCGYGCDCCGMEIGAFWSSIRKGLTEKEQVEYLMEELTIQHKQWKCWKSKK